MDAEGRDWCILVRPHGIVIVWTFEIYWTNLNYIAYVLCFGWIVGHDGNFSDYLWYHLWRSHKGNKHPLAVHTHYTRCFLKMQPSRRVAGGCREQPVRNCLCRAARVGRTHGIHGVPAFLTAMVHANLRGVRWAYKILYKCIATWNSSPNAMHQKHRNSVQFETWCNASNMLQPSPTLKVDLCGHATLGAAHALWSTGRASKRRRIDFETKASGVLRCELSEGGWIQMDFPADPPNMFDASLPHPDHLCKALGLPSESVLAVGRGRFDILCELKPAAFDALWRFIDFYNCSTSFLSSVIYLIYILYNSHNNINNVKSKNYMHVIL